MPEPATETDAGDRDTYGTGVDPPLRTGNWAELAGAANRAGASCSAGRFRLRYLIHPGTGALGAVHAAQVRFARQPHSANRRTWISGPIRRHYLAARRARMPVHSPVSVEQVLSPGQPLEVEAGKGEPIIRKPPVPALVQTVYGAVVSDRQV